MGGERRWIRLLFGREFPYDDLLALWDKLFAEDPDLELIDLICVSMLLRIRWQCKMPFRIMKTNGAN
jgi:TBC1 domain family protein 5